MSAAPKLTKKQKKAVAFRDRKGKGKSKSAPEDGVRDLPEGLEEEQDGADAVETPELPAVKAPKQKKVESSSAHVPDAAEASKGSKGVEKTKKRKREETDEIAVAGDKQKEGAPKRGKKAKPDTETGKATADAGAEGVEANESADAGRRFILFLGNLKYTTSKEAIAKHFSACDPPPTIRLLTPKPKPGANGPLTAKSKGCAFLEFKQGAALQQALKLHHSQLDGRQVNVELTAGGGGKSEARISKLKVRNRELHGQRTKRAEMQKAGPDGAGHDLDPFLASRAQRYSATSGVEKVLLVKRTWTVGDTEDDETHRGGVKHKKTKKRGARVKDMGTGVNSIPVG